MKRDSLAKLEDFIRHGLVKKLRTDLKKLRITKEADAECCIYYHLRRTLPANGVWTLLARKYTKRTKHFIDLLVLKNKRPRLAIEIKWNSTQMSDKDRHSLDAALRKMRVNKAYFISVGPKIVGSNYEKIRKTHDEKHRLHEIRVGLGLMSSGAAERIELWKKERDLLGKHMRIGKAKLKELLD